MPFTVDCDSHFSPKDMFDDVDPRFGDRAPRRWMDATGRSRTTYAEREAGMSDHQRWILPNGFLWSRGPQPAAYSDPVARVEDLDRLGIDVQVLVVPGGMFHENVEPELAASVCASHNNAMARVIQKVPGRYISLARLPMQSPTRALEELDRAITELGMHAPAIFTNVNGRNLDEPEFWPIYARVEELGVPLIIHPSRSGVLLGLERLTKFHLDNSLGFLYEATLAITSLITGGVLDMFPRLRIGLLETGCGYLPTLMDRLNEVYDCEGVDKLIKKRPHEYLDQFWITANVSSERETLAYVAKRYGADRLMIGMDYPHGLGGSGESTVNDLRSNPNLTEAEKAQIFGLNAAKLFGIPAVVPATAERVAATA